MAIETFSSERLHAERLRREHYDDLVRMHADPRFMAFLGGTRDRAQTRDYLARNLEHWERFGFGVWMLREGGGSAAIGRAVLRHLPVSGVDEVELGYALTPDYWGRGLATEVGSACVALAREELSLATIVATTDPRHEASQHVLTKLGFRRTPEALIENEPLAFFRLRLKA